MEVASTRLKGVRQPKVPFFDLLTQIGLGEVKLTPLGRKKFIFKWPKLRLCDLITFEENMRGSVWPNLEVISTFFEFLQMFKVKLRPKKRQNIDFSIFENSNQKTVEVMVKNV